jgi:hypothetical protein
MRTYRTLWYRALLVDESPTVHYVRTQSRYKKGTIHLPVIPTWSPFSLATVVDRWGTLFRNLFAATIKPLE